MPKKIQDCTMAHLVGVPLPQHAATYTVISHQFVIDYSKQQLVAAGFNIVDEEYRCTADGQIAQGVYRLNYNLDPELHMMFAWTNSYNKQVKFKCLIGGYITATETVMTSGDIGTWTRKHTGAADVETKATIDDQIANAHMYYSQLVSDKAFMETITMTRRKQAQMLGILFAEYGILTTEQASIIRSQMDRPSHVYKNNDSLWAFYNYVTISLQISHPRTWIEDQRVLHYFLDTVNKFPKAGVVVVPKVEAVEEPEFTDPNQINLLDQIAEIEAIEAVETLIQNSESNKEDEEEIAVCPPPAEIQIHIESDEEYAKRVAEIEGEPEELEVESEFALEDNVEDIITYTDPVGNTFEAPVVEEAPKMIDLSEPEKLSLDDILIRIPNAQKAEELEKSENDLFDMEQDLALGSDEDDEDLDSIPDFF
jgi:hypothetical protein